MSEHTDASVTMRIEIAGTVDADERDAVVAALTVLHHQRSMQIVPDGPTTISGWVRAARREGIRPSQDTWGRGTRG